MKITLKLFALLLILSFLSCSDKSTEPEVEVIDYTFQNFIDFESISNVHLKETRTDLNNPNNLQPLPEYYIWQEKIIGEPFTDNNGNGVYDNGIDGFIISTGPENQDLNHNGVYDGPNDPYFTGEPFDDIDGDGLRINNPNWAYNNSKLSSTPYADYNGNGTWDQNPNFNYSMVKRTTTTLDPTSKLHSFIYIDSSYHFLSDSGLHYYLTGDIYTSGNWDLYSFRVSSEDGLYFYRPSSSFKLLDTGAIVSDNDFEADTSIGFSVYDYEFFRKVTTGASLTINGITYKNLVKIEAYYLRGARNEVDYWEFYFDPNLSLIALYYREETANEETWYYYDKRVNSNELPFEMTQ